MLEIRSLENASERVSLRKTLSRTEIWALAFGAIVGWGWVMMAGRWVGLAGTLGAICAFLIAMVFCSLIGMAYAELTPALPLAGGELVFSYRAVGYNFGWFTGWAMSFAYVAVAAWEGPAFATAVDYLVNLPEIGSIWTIEGYTIYSPWLIVAILGTLFTVGCHYFGMRVTAIFNTIAAIALVVGGLVFSLGSITFGDIANAVPWFQGGTDGLIAVLLMAPAMFVGFDVIPQAVEEMSIPLKQVGNLVIFAICLGGLWYILMILGVAFGAPYAFTKAAKIPVADVTAYVMNSRLLGSLVIVAGIGGILTSWNAMYLGGSRIIFAMARAKMLPPIFAKIHPKYGSPYVAILLIGTLGLLGTLTGKNALGCFVDAFSFGVVVGYLCVSISFFILKKKEPELKRPFIAPGGRFMGILSILASICFIVLYLPFGPGGGLGYHEWYMVILWVVIGTILYLVNNFQHSYVSNEEREFLIFGEKYSRPARLNKK